MASLRSWRRWVLALGIAAVIVGGTTGGILAARSGGSSGRPALPVASSTVPAGTAPPGLPPELSQLRAEVARSGRIPSQGTTVTTHIPPTVSHFVARDALVWLPPAWFSTVQPHLPLIILLPGEPSSPSDWVTSGDADVTADHFAMLHHGVAPIVVMPDPTGSEDGDTECVNSARFGNAETYLIDDVPSWARTVLGAATGPRSLAFAGLSAGGTCSVVLALRHPDVVVAFASYSGFATPTYKNDDVEMSIPVLFGGSEAAFLAHDPLTLLREHRYPDTGAWFEGGDDDHTTVAAARELEPAAVAAGLHTCIGFIAGGHDYGVWKQAWADSLPWLSSELGLTPAPSQEKFPCDPATTGEPG